MVAKRISLGLCSCVLTIFASMFWAPSDQASEGRDRLTLRMPAESQPGSSESSPLAFAGDGSGAGALADEAGDGTTNGHWLVRLAGCSFMDSSRMIQPDR